MYSPFGWNFQNLLSFPFFHDARRNNFFSLVCHEVLPDFVFNLSSFSVNILGNFLTLNCARRWRRRGPAPKLISVSCFNIFSINNCPVNALLNQLHTLVKRYPYKRGVGPKIRLQQVLTSVISRFKKLMNKGVRFC